MAAFYTVNVAALTPWTGSLKVTERLLFRLTRRELLPGVNPLTVGAGPVVNVQLVLANGVPVVSRMAVAPPPASP
ncbi:hypothetical protein AHiyo4_43200 [Arthrobacter sp. Hiyo4]|nr:hypothetical protein AHiyo4_43200 [Arthrobacter sp. Hiyo4]